MPLLIWAGVLVIGAFVAHWGADKLSAPLKKVRRQWGLTAVAGGALVGIAAAGSEIGINTISAYRGVSDIGLGMMLGSNIVSVPLIVTTAYFVSRTESLGGGNGENDDSGSNGSTGQSNRLEAGHEQHRQENLLRIGRDAVHVLTVPYLGILALVAILTVPEPVRGLQPLDGVVMGAAYLVYLGQAFIRGRSSPEDVEWKRKEIGLAVAGLIALAAGAYTTVRATENIVAGLGITRLIGGLFITAIVTALPEIFATRSVVKSGQVTAGTTSVIGDNAVTMTVAFLPLAVVTVPIENFQLYWVNLTFVAIVAAMFGLLIHVGSVGEHGFERWQVLALDGVYLLYLIVIIFWVL
ncbi:sodium:calcium exchanger [Natrinema sp. CBA1119]|uniref:sodium:calcium antiporter n=1 Tax=Natrinema sp. CBA1119 TaxID=1608465 RepID=UPI000BF395D9|nr:sodium:calcium exchanger [Natrinema sp. CBA1119]PGF14636.1 sodium:calcium exchanger [Natrinema sp. CBA1119]